MFTAALLLTANRWEEPKHPPQLVSKQNVAHPYKGILTDHEKERSTNMYYNTMNLENTLSEESHKGPQSM